MANHLLLTRLIGLLKVIWAGICLCIMAGGLVSNALAQYNDEECFDKELDRAPAEYLKQQQKYHYGIVYSNCWAGKHSRLLLLLPLSNHTYLDDILGLRREPPRHPKEEREVGVPALFYYYKGCVVNAGSLEVAKDLLRLDEIAQGGMWQMNRLADAAHELASFPLTFLPSGNVMDALSAKPTRECRSLTKISPEVP